MLVFKLVYLLFKAAPSRSYWADTLLHFCSQQEINNLEFDVNSQVTAWSHKISCGFVYITAPKSQVVLSVRNYEDKLIKKPIINYNTLEGLIRNNVIYITFGTHIQ